MRLLLVEDEEELARPLSELLKREGHGVDCVGDGDLAWQQLTHHSYDLLILDWMLPGLSGLELCTRIRQLGSSTPVLMLTAKDTIENKLAGFEAGVDDYLVKPFELRELLARVRALLRRPVQLLPEELSIADLVVDLRNHTARRGERVVDLSSKEYQLLEYFIYNPGRILTHEEILRQLWRDTDEAVPNTLAAQVKLLRRKLDKEFETPLIHTIYGQGYRFGV